LLSTPGKFWLLVGKLREREYGGDIAYSFDCRGIIDLEEVL
jgi:hypothetical protein